MALDREQERLVDPAVSLVDTLELQVHHVCSLSVRVTGFTRIHMATTQTSYLSLVSLFHEIKSVVLSLYRLLNTGTHMTHSSAINSGSAGSIPSRSIWDLY